VDIKLKGHSRLVRLRIRYHFMGNVHITLHHKLEARAERNCEAHLSKPCRFDVFPSQSSAYISVIVEK